mgnify:CR=1 FL=1
MHYSSILPDVIKIADEASEKVLHIYQSDFKVNYKEDHSPITAADIGAQIPPQMAGMFEMGLAGLRMAGPSPLGE